MPPPDLVQAAHRVHSLGQLGELLRQLQRRHARHHRGTPLTGRELARRSGYSHGAIAEYLAGRTLPPTDRFDVLVELLGASPAEQGALATARDRVEEQRRARETAAAPVPRQLPTGVPGFAGRGPELAELDRQCRADGPGQLAAVPVVVIAGSAGVGKTALAVHWAHRVRERFPDGQLYVNLRGYAAGAPLSPRQVLARFLPALGMPADQVPVDLDEAAAAYRSRLADRRVLVLLDNAADPEQVRPLLPGGSSCLVLVTSRDRLAGLVARDGARRLPLAVLPPGDARALLASLLGAGRVGTEPAAAEELAQLCGRLPLALRIAAANLGAGPELALTEFVAQLRDADRLGALAVDGDAQAAVAVAFDLSYRRLPAPTRRTFRRLGLVPGPDVTAEAVAALVDTTPAQAAHQLAALADGHLVDERAPGRYAYHDLLRVYARERVRTEEPPGDAAAAQDRLYRYYHRAADAATGLLYPVAIRLPQPSGSGPAGPPPVEFPDPPAAARWLDQELPNLVAAVQHAATGATPAATWRIANGLRGYLHRSAPMADAELVVAAALAAAEAAGDRLAEGYLRLDRSTLRMRRGETSAAIADSSQALAACRDAGWVDGQAAALANLAAGHARLGELRQTVEYGRAATARFEQVGSRTQLAAVIGSLPVPMLLLGQREEAIRYAGRAYQLAAELGSDYLRALTLSDLGMLHWWLGELTVARRCFVQALALYRRHRDQEEESHTLSGLAEVHCDLGHPRLAGTFAQAGLRIAQRLEHPLKQITALLALARTHERGQAAAAARPPALRAHELAQTLGDRRAQSRALIALAAAHRLDPAGQPAARTTVDQALALARSGELRLLEGQALTLSAEIWLAAGDPDRAAAEAEQALAIHRATGHRPGAVRTHALLGRLRLRSGDRDGDGHRAGAAAGASRPDRAGTG